MRVLCQLHANPAVVVWAYPITHEFSDTVGILEYHLKDGFEMCAKSGALSML